MFELNACRVPIRVQRLSSAAIRWVRLHFVHLQILAKAWNCYAFAEAEPAFFNGRDELAALLWRHATLGRHGARAESKEQLMRKCDAGKHPLPNW